MITLMIDNSTCNIANAPKELFDKLRNAMSYHVQDSNGRYNKSDPRTKRYLIDKRGNFPRGLLHIVNRTVPTNSVKIVHRYTLPKRLLSLSIISVAKTPYDEQNKAVLAASTHHCGSIEMPTGTGKSFCMALLIEQMRVSTLVVVPTLELKRQLTETFLELFGPTKHIVVENIDSPNLRVKRNFGMLIIDEAHHAAATTYRKLNIKVWDNIYHKFFFTATAFRNQPEENLLLQSIAGPIIYKLDYKTAVDRKLIVPVEAYYYELPKQDVNGYTWNTVYKELITDNKKRNDLIKQLLTNLADSGKSSLCLVKEVRHGENLSPFPFVNGQDEDSRHLISKFNSGKVLSLVGTEGVISEGVDTRRCEYVIVAGLGKSKGALMQKIGRGVRNYYGKESCKVILFYDKSNKWTRAHFREQVKVLMDEYGVTPLKLSID